MKRLVRKADAARLHELALDANNAVSAIGIKEGISIDEMWKKIKKDTGANKYAYWGAISDDMKYVAEAYVYMVGNDRKSAFVFAPLVQGSDGNFTPGSTYDVVIKTIDNNTGIRPLAQSGITINSGEKIMFSQDFTNIEVAKEYVNSQEVKTI